MHHILAFRVVVQAVLGDVYHDTLARSRWQDEAGRENDVRPLSRQPRIDPRVRRDQLEITEIVAFTDRGEGIFVLRFDDLDLTDDIVTLRRQWQLKCGARACR